MPAWIRSFLESEEGELHPGFSFLMITLVASIPLGLMGARMYRALCEAGIAANFVLGLF